VWLTIRKEGLPAGANPEGAAMKRLCLTIACLSAVAWTQASADNLSPDPGYSYRIPTDPQGGLSISMGQDQGGHTTGGLKWGF
jgi:hypothetical protein